MQPASALWSNNVKGLKGKPARQHGRIIVGVGVLPSDKSLTQFGCHQETTARLMRQRVGSSLFVKDV